MDHFALRDEDLACAQEEGRLHRNFKGYTHPGHCDLIGLGVAIIGQVIHGSPEPATVARRPPVG